jgi:hypothetical protein
MVEAPAAELRVGGEWRYHIDYPDAYTMKNAIIDRIWGTTEVGWSPTTTPASPPSTTGPSQTSAGCIGSADEQPPRL